MNPKDFYSMTPAETYLKMKGFNNNRWVEWQHTRLISYNIYASIPRKKNQSIMSIEKFFPLPTDKKVKFMASQEEMQSKWEILRNKTHGK